MPDQTLVDNIRKENYALRIFIALDHKPVVIEITTRLIKFVQEVYRSLEPSHFKGKLIICSSLDDSVLFDESTGTKLYDRSVLVNNNSDIIVLQLFQDEKLPLMWQNITLGDLFNSGNAVIYYYKASSECFYANGTAIPINNPFHCASIFALHYHYLSEALNKYKHEKIRYSSCTIFQESWFDMATRLYFKQKPEETMQKSLKEFLSSALRGVDVVREYNLGASKPVDVRVYWREANRAALIEVKWLGQSKNDNGELTTAYSNGRGNEGLVQLKEYMDLERQDTPTCITKGYLVIIDGRRKGLAVNPDAISAEEAFHYKDIEIRFDNDKRYYQSITGFEEPMRMFAEPICS